MLLKNIVHIKKLNRVYKSMIKAKKVKGKVHPGIGHEDPEGE